MRTLDVNEAMRVYLGSGGTGGVLPYGMQARIEEEYGVDASEVEELVREVLEAVGAVPVERRHEALSEIALLIAEQARATRFGLADDVCRSIGNYVAYSYR